MASHHQPPQNLFPGLLRVLRQPDHLEAYQAKVQALVNAVTAGSCTPHQVYREVFRQAVLGITDSVTYTIPTGADAEGFMDMRTIQAEEGSTQVQEQQQQRSATRTVSVVDTIQQLILRQGLAPPTLPPLDWSFSTDSPRLLLVLEMLQMYLLILVGYRRCHDLQHLLDHQLPTILDHCDAAVTLEHIVGNAVENFPSPLNMAARVGGKQCTQLLLATGLVNPSEISFSHHAMMIQHPHSILDIVLQTWQRCSSSSNDILEQINLMAANADTAEPIDFPGVLQALLDAGARVTVSELQKAMQFTTTTTSPNDAKLHVLEQLLQVATVEQQDGPLDVEDLTELAPTAILMDTKEQQQQQGDDGTTSSRLSLLLSLGVDPNGTISELVVPWVESTTLQTKKTTSLLEVAIHSNSTSGLRALLSTSDHSLLEHGRGVLDRVLSSSLSETTMAILDEALENHGIAKNSLKPCVTTIRSGTAWIGNVPDFETYLYNQQNPPKAPKFDHPSMAAWKRQQEQDAARTNSSVKFPDLPADKGDWIGVAPTPFLQLVFHVDCPEDYLIGAVTGAIYGGFKAGEWNPVYPPESDMFFTGRMIFSEQDPRHVTWFMDAGILNVEDEGSLDDATLVLQAMKELPVPDYNTLERLELVSLVGTWATGQGDTQRNGIMWTCRQEYRYGIVAGSKVFISIGYEAMDLPPEKIALILDAVLRAKYHYHHSQQQAPTSKAPFFHRTRFSEVMPDNVAQVPKKRTPAEIFEHDLEHGGKFTGLDTWWAEIPPKESLKGFVPQYRIYDREFINRAVQEKFDCSLAKGLEEDVALLLDELVMMFLDSQIISKVIDVLQNSSGEPSVTVSSITQKLASVVFPDYDESNTLAHHCYKKLTIAREGTTEDDQNGTRLVKERLKSFLKRRARSVGPPDEPGHDLSILDDFDFVDRIFSVCHFLVLETLELANNSRQDCFLPAITPAHIRWAIFGDSELNQIFSADLVKEFYYPQSDETIIVE